MLIALLLELLVLERRSLARLCVDSCEETKASDSVAAVRGPQLHFAPLQQDCLAVLLPHHERSPLGTKGTNVCFAFQKRGPHDISLHAVPARNPVWCRTRIAYAGVLRDDHAPNARSPTGPARGAKKCISRNRKNSCELSKGNHYWSS